MFLSIFIQNFIAIPKPKTDLQNLFSIWRYWGFCNNKWCRKILIFWSVSSLLHAEFSFSPHLGRSPRLSNAILWTKCLLCFTNF